MQEDGLKRSMLFVLSDSRRNPEMALQCKAGALSLDF